MFSQLCGLTVQLFFLPFPEPSVKNLTLKYKAGGIISVLEPAVFKCHPISSYNAKNYSSLQRMKY